MIAAIGLDVDPTFPVFVAAALAHETPVTVLNLRAAVEGEWRVPLPPSEPAQFSFGGIEIELRPEDTYFCRLIDMSSQQQDPELARRWFALTRALGAWLNQAPQIVANRPHVGAHNSAKPFHEAILGRLGFKVPASITSSDPEELLAFAREGPTISKAVSGVRADTEIATPDLLGSFDPSSGPLHLQRRVLGTDIRAHVVGDRVLAQAIASGDGVDYRRDGRFDELEVVELPEQLTQQLAAASRELELPFAGWDLRLDPSGEYWCLEVNPMPGYGPYDSRCDGAISALLLDYLGGES